MVFLYLIVSSDLSNDSFNKFCKWCLENNDLRIQRLLLFGIYIFIIFIVDHKISDANQKDLVSILKSPQCTGLIDLNLAGTYFFIIL